MVLAVSWCTRQVTVDGDARFLATADYKGGTVTSVGLDSDGALQPHIADVSQHVGQRYVSERFFQMWGISLAPITRASFRFFPIDNFTMNTSFFLNDEMAHLANAATRVLVRDSSDALEVSISVVTTMLLDDFHLETIVESHDSESPTHTGD